MKKFIAASVFFTLLFSMLLLSVSPSPDAPVLPASVIANTFEKRTGTFQYIKGYSDTYFYDDRYFWGDATQYNPQLSTMSFCLALSAFSVEEADGDTDFSNNFLNVRNLLCDELGYTDFSANDSYSQEPTTDSIAVAAAQKKVYDEQGIPCTIIAVAVRGGGYGKEWTSNFTLGESGQAQGFREAKEQVLEFLKNYISNNNQIRGKVKFWITGFSRGAATSNLVAGTMNDDPYILGSHIEFSKNDIFAYCFATPKGALKEDILAKDSSHYSNIWNILNINDPVPLVAMEELGFARYGNDRYFPDPLADSTDFSSKQKQMESYYEKLSSYSEVGEYLIDDFHMKEIIPLSFLLSQFTDKDINEVSENILSDDLNNNWTQGRFLQTAITAITIENVKTRSNYVSEFEGGIRTLLETVYGSAFAEYSSKTKESCFDIFLKKLKEPLNILKFLNGIFNPKSSLSSFMTSLLAESFSECGQPIPDEKIPELEKFAKAATSLVSEFAIKHPNLTITLISNINHIASAHNHELYFAWLKTEDKNYAL
ncbi:MAG: hypothetical protein IJO09_07710 [Oscillospiraceae bacterium]|nr:hypothetical protein [Oscillospiraceae bacterium]